MDAIEQIRFRDLRRLPAKRWKAALLMRLPPRLGFY